MPKSLFNKVAALRPATLLKKILWHRCFPVNFEKFLRTPFVTEHVRRLLLVIMILLEAITEMFCKKGVLQNFSKFTGKYQCSSLILIKLKDFRLQHYGKKCFDKGFFLRTLPNVRE